MREKAGFFQEVAMRIKLVVRLMADRRVNFLFKALPLFTIVYFFSPDPIIGPIDDTLALFIGGFLFVELCPPEIVEEHLQEMRAKLKGITQEEKRTDEDVIDAEFQDAEEDKTPKKK